MLSKELNTLLDRITRLAENRHELLLGQCQSSIKLTNTQEHIIMLLRQGPSTNSKLSVEIGMTQAAVTKAMKRLQSLGLVTDQKDPIDERMTIWSLTPDAKGIAKEHANHHKETLQAYTLMLNQFSNSEQATIAKFIHALYNLLEGDHSPKKGLK